MSLCLLRLSRAFPRQKAEVLSLGAVSTCEFATTDICAKLLFLEGCKDNHYNALVLDRQSRVLLWFEPHGAGLHRDDRSCEALHVDEWTEALRALARREDVMLLEPIDFEPWRIQVDEPVCGAACLMFLEGVAQLYERGCSRPVREVAREVSASMSERAIVRYAAAVTAEAEREVHLSCHAEEYPYALRRLIITPR